MIPPACTTILRLVKGFDSPKMSKTELVKGGPSFRADDASHHLLLLLAPNKILWETSCWFEVCLLQLREHLETLLTPFHIP